MIVNYIAVAAVVSFLTRLARQWYRGESEAESSQSMLGESKPGQSKLGQSKLGQSKLAKMRASVYMFLAGAVFANSIPHFIHCISGEHFPAPFFRNLGKGTATNVVNVLWGLFCFGAGCNLARNYQMHSPTMVRVLVCSGFIAMSVFLSVVFSRGAFR